ncbi:outer membrane lipoprotein carrier protein LolA [bacterium]|nr:outer membrane lipoprotein carrier protein LolA [bacterium]
MKKIFFLLFLAALYLQAESTNEVDAALSSLGEKVKNLASFTADFRQLDKDPLFMEESEHKGKLSFCRKAAPGATNCFLRFDYTEPEKSVTILAPNGILIYTDDMTEPQFSPSRDPNRADMVFSTFVSPVALKRHYDIAFNKPEVDKISFRLTPKSSFAKEFFSEAEVDFSKKTGLPERLRQVKLNGQDITLFFTSPAFNVSLPTNYFDASYFKKAK